MRTQGQAPGFHRPDQFDIVVQMWNKKRRRLFEQFTQVKNTRNYSVKAATEGGLNVAAIVNEGGSIDPQDFATPYYAEYTPRKRAVGFSVSREATESDFNNLLANRAPKMVDSIRKAEEIDFHNMALNLATSSANATPDGLSLANAAHLRDGSTFSNIVTGNPVLSYEGLRAARQLMMEIPDHTGDPLMIDGPFILLVPPALEDLAHRLTDTNKLPTTNDNDINYSGREIKVVASPYFNVSTTAWALVSSDAMYNPLHQFVRSPLYTDDDKVIERDGRMYIAAKIWARVPKDPRGYVYSAGA